MQGRKKRKGNTISMCEHRNSQTKLRRYMRALVTVTQVLGKLATITKGSWPAQKHSWHVKHNLGQTPVSLI